MEMFEYICEVCGYLHDVPAYWSSFKAEPTVELEHLNMGTGDICTNTILKYNKQE